MDSTSQEAGWVKISKHCVGDNFIGTRWANADPSEPDPEVIGEVGALDDHLLELCQGDLPSPIQVRLAGDKQVTGKGKVFSFFISFSDILT